MRYDSDMPRGFSLIEVVVSLFVIGVVILLSASIIRAVPLSRHAKYENQAASIAQNELESLRSGGYSALPASGSFTDSLLSTLPSGSGTVDVSDYNAKTKQVSVTVSWQEENATTTSSVAVTTLITSIGSLP